MKARKVRVLIFIGKSSFPIAFKLTVLIESINLVTRYSNRKLNVS